MSVIDPRGDAEASVSGIPRDAFLLRLDGEPLTEDLLARTSFDEICPPRRDGAVARGAIPRELTPSLIALVDLNFLDSRTRHAVADALDEVAEMLGPAGARLKVLAFSHRLEELTPGFTRDAAAVHRAADRLRGTVGPVFPGRGLEGLPRRDRDDPIDPTPYADRYSGELVTSPDDTVSALEFGIPSVIVTEQEQQRFEQQKATRSPIMELAARRVDPRPSLAAIEAVLLANRSLRGRKALVLFTSTWFDLPEAMWDLYLDGISVAAQSGFSIWTVDARGLDRAGGYDSRLLGRLAGLTGGAVVRGAGRLAIALERALDEMSCYYLFTLPVPDEDGRRLEHRVRVDLDTDRYPRYWNFRVRHAPRLTVLPERDRRQRTRLAALLSPEAYGYPEVRVSAGYPAGSERFTLPVEVSVLLADLAFSPAAGRHRARFAWEGVVEDLDSREPVCTLGDGLERTVEVEQLPSRHPPALLVLEQTCRLPGPGRYEVRVVVEDLSSGDIGAAARAFRLPEVGPNMARVSALRLGRNSGRDFLLEVGRSPAALVRRDVGRRAFVPLEPNEAIAASDRLKVRFVACGDRRPPHVVLYRARGGDREPMFQLIATPLGGQHGGGVTCREYEAFVPEETLSAGRYGIALVSRSRDVTTLDALVRALRQGRILAESEFTVAGTPPVRRGPDVDEITWSPPRRPARVME